MIHVHGKDAFQCIPRDRLNRGLQVLLPRLAAGALAWALLAVTSSPAQNSKPTEYQVKAAYLYNFGRFVEWPAKSRAAKDGPFTICVLGQDPFGPTLNAILADETIAGKNVVTERIPRPEDAVKCQILFISSSEESQLKHILATLDTASVLTVSDLPQFSRSGGMVQFVLEGTRVRFEVNLAPTEHAGLTLSSELLKLATSVRRSSHPGD